MEEWAGESSSPAVSYDVCLTVSGMASGSEEVVSLLALDFSENKKIFVW